MGGSKPVTDRDKKNGKKRKGVWEDIQTFDEPESGLAVIITERTRGAPAYSFYFVHLDRRGGDLTRVNKFIQVPCNGDTDVEHVLYSLAKRAREFVAEKIVENKAKSEAADKAKADAPKDEKKKGTRRGQRGKKGGDDRGKPKPRGGLSTLARTDAEAGGHEYKGPTRRRREKRQQSKKEQKSA